MRTLFLFSGLALITLTTRAQSLQFGLGLEAGQSKLDPGFQALTASPFSKVATFDNPGFALTLIARAPLAAKLYLAACPALLWQNQEAVFQVSGSEVEQEEKIQPLSALVPLRLEWQVGEGGWRPLLAAGGGILFNLTKDANTPFESKRISPYWEAGLGVEVVLPRFHMRPEFGWRLGTGSIANDEADNDFNAVFRKLDWSYLSFRVVFYGK